MYCERCGKQIDNALNFCNACGAQLKKEKGEQQSVLNLMITALIVVCTAGLGVLVGLMAILLNNLPNPEPAFIFAIFYLATLFGIVFLIMRQVSKLIDAKLKGKDIDFESPRRREEQPLVQLPPKTTAQLEEQRQPASVIENTTRTLDEVPWRQR
ncbi:MAG: zinc ribbon domain-containing protein [Pyrinomonadaceae bacterium]